MTALVSLAEAIKSGLKFRIPPDKWPHLTWKFMDYEEFQKNILASSAYWVRGILEADQFELEPQGGRTYTLTEFLEALDVCEYISAADRRAVIFELKKKK